jgi:tetratricopeptide (TPR) repeat protein
MVYIDTRKSRWQKWSLPDHSLSLPVTPGISLDRLAPGYTRKWAQAAEARYMNDSAYWDLYQQGAAALCEARFADAETVLAQAWAEARGLADRVVAERARCNLAAAQIMLGTTEALEEDLSRILGASQDLKTRQLAAYNLATFHNAERRTRIGRFYANMSLEMARRLRDGFSQGASAYLLALIDAEEGRPRRSRDRLQEALDSGFGEDAPFERMLVLSTLAYAQVLTGNRNGAVQALEASEKIAGGEPVPLRGLGLPTYEPTLRLNLGFSYLEMGELDRALHHGRKALDSLEEHRPADDLYRKHGLYLLGESHAQRGEVQEAREHFHELQRVYYPQLPDLTELLLKLRTHTFLSWIRV